MVRITVKNELSHIEADGKKEELIMEACFALLGAIQVLRECGKSDAFIQAVFDTSLHHADALTE